VRFLLFILDQLIFTSHVLKYWHLLYRLNENEEVAKKLQNLDLLVR